MKKLCFSFVLAMMTTCSSGYASEYCKQALRNPLKIGDVIGEIYWSDADSGRANGVCFRMSNLDAAETGPVGFRGGAKCEEERKLGYDSKAYIVGLTKKADKVVTGTYGYDRFDRQIIDMSVSGKDLRQKGINEGVYRSWVFKNGKPLWAKPSYCN